MIRQAVPTHEELTHHLTYVVEHADVDGFGVVHFSRYVAVMESAVLHYFEHLGTGLGVLEEHDLHLVVRELVVRYLSPSLYLDQLTFAVHVDRVGPAHLRTGILVTRAPESGAEPVASGRIDWAVVNRVTKEPARFPAPVEDTLRRVQQRPSPISPG